MKKIYAVLLALCLMLSCSAMAEQAGTPLPEFLPESVFAAQEPPIAVSFRFDGEAGGIESLIADPYAVLNVMDYLSAITVGDKNDLGVSDADSYYTFLFADGSSQVIHFEGRSLCLDRVCYDTEWPADLRAPAFPGYGYSIGYQPLTEAMQDFFNADVPVQLTVDDAGTVRSITNADDIDLARTMLYFLELCDCVNEDQFEAIQEKENYSEYTLTFAMEDGSEYVFRFFDQWLCVEYPESIGVRYCWFPNFEKI